jgi:hypothetical protein
MNSSGIHTASIVTTKIAPITSQARRSCPFAFPRLSLCRSNITHSFEKERPRSNRCSITASSPQVLAVLRWAPLLPPGTPRGRVRSSCTMPRKKQFGCLPVRTWQLPIQ